MLEPDTTLPDKIRTLFREQGITIVSILTAISLAISTIVASIVASIKPIQPPTPPTPSSGGGIKEWIQKTQKNLSNLVNKKLGLKALDALPGIIGGLLSWLLTFLSNTVGWLAEHVWLFVTGVGAMIIIYIQN